MKTIVSLLLILFTSTLFAEPNHTQSLAFSTVKVSEKISMLQGKGGNIAILTGPDGTLMIDDDYKVMSEALVSELSKYGGKTNLNYLINTHWHGDHTEGNFVLGDSTQIVAHENVRKRLLTKQEVKLFNMVVEPYPAHALPSITYEKKMTLHFNNETVDIVYFAGGHTDGDSIVFFKEANVVHMGDHFFSGMFPFVDVGTGGNVLTMAKNVKMVLKTIDEETKVIPGHGSLSNKADLQAFYKMLVGTSDEVAKMKKDGLSLSEIEKKGLSEQWKIWGKGFLPEKIWLGIVYSSL